MGVLGSVQWHLTCQQGEQPPRNISKLHGNKTQTSFNTGSCIWLCAEAIGNVCLRQLRTSTRQSVSALWLQPAPTSRAPTSLCQLVHRLSPAASPLLTPACMEATPVETALPLTTGRKASWWKRHPIRIGEESISLRRFYRHLHESMNEEEPFKLTVSWGESWGVVK